MAENLKAIVPVSQREQHAPALNAEVFARALWGPLDVPPRWLNQKRHANHSTPLPPDDNSHTTIPDSHIIRRYDAEGKSPTEIGELLGITAQSVRNVLAGFAEQGQLVDPGLQVLELIRQANCPDRKWPTAELLNAIGFSPRVRTTIERHCQWSAVAMLNLRDVFEFFVSDESTKKTGVVITPFLGFRNGGEIGFWEAVHRITELDLGESANAIWRLKFKWLEQANRIKGPGRYAWSKPVLRAKGT